MWTKTFMLTLLENSVATGLATFAGSLVITTTPTFKDFLASAVAGGISALYNFSKGLGGQQALKAAKASSK